jgi:hypothetical protein
MSYVVYNTQSTKVIGSSRYSNWKTAAAAKAHLTRMGKMGYNVNEYAVADQKVYQDSIEKTVTKVNLMSGQEYQESVNTPYYCSPSSETYWSM